MPSSNQEKKKDRPLVVPKNSVNFAFVGQFAETPRDTILLQNTQYVQVWKLFIPC